MCFSHFSITVANTATKAAYKSRTKWPYSSMMGQCEHSGLDSWELTSWNQQTDSTGDGRKLLKQQSLTHSDKPPPTRPYFPILPKQFHLLGTTSSDIWASGRQSHPHCHNVSVWGSMCMSTWMMVPAEARGVGSPGARASGSCEPSYVDTGNWTQVLCKSSTHS